MNKLEARERAQQVMATLTDPRTGKVYPAHERDRILKNMAREQRAEEAKQKAEAGIEELAKPPLPTRQQLLDQMSAREEGRRQAAKQAAEQAAAEAGPINPFLKPLESFRGQKSALA